MTKNTDTDDQEDWELVAPDGGWGWLVLGGTLLVNMLIPGTIKSFGVLFVEFLETFQASPVAASWIPALCYFLYCSLGPLASWLSVRYSYRAVTLAGGLAASAGMILSYFANSIIYLYFSYGVLVGTGAGLSFPPGIFIVTSYFVKYRGLANGLAISGSAIGSIVLPPFLRYLLENYGYRGAVLIMGGITLNVLVGALLYEPVEKHMKRVKVVRSQVVAAPEPLKVCDGGESGVKRKEGEEALKEEEEEEELRGTLKEPLLDGGRKTSLVRSALSLASTGAEPGRKISTVSAAPRKTSRPQPPAPVLPRNYSVASNMSSSSFRYVSTAFHGSTLVGLHPEFSSSPQLAPPKASVGLCGCSLWFCSCARAAPQKKLQPKQAPAKQIPPKQQPTSMVALLKDPVYLIILASNASNAIGYTNFTILVPAYALSLGFDKSQASYLLSIVAALDLIGRIGGSALSDWIPLDRRVYFVGGLLVSGVTLALLPLASSYVNVAGGCALFGLASGTYVGVTAVVMVDALGEQALASSYGLSLLLNGVLQLVGPPVCGAIYEALGTYSLIFTGLGVSLILGAAVWGILPFLPRTKTLPKS